MDPNFDKKTMSKRRAVVSIILSLLAFWLIFSGDNRTFWMPAALMVVMVVLSTVADMMPEEKKFIARSLKSISFVLNVIVLFLIIILGVSMLL